MQIVDVSDFQTGIDWHKVKAAGVKGVWIKETEGASWTSKLAKTHRANALSVGLRVGGYHFARPDLNDPETEADHFANILGKVGRKDLKPMLDMETAAKTHSGQLLLGDWSRKFNKRFRETRGVNPGFYSYGYFIETMGIKVPIGNGLWYPNYSVNDGHMHPATPPAPWKHYVAHQYTSKGRVAGISGYVDISYAPRLQGVLAHPIVGLV